ncbi:MAG: RNA-binding transcriptional accessory protein [Oscillospiraceae bacterium]|nr:RNA-binding transcriptional accessory protein [Oscillospiraceae bacterium]
MTITQKLAQKLAAEFSVAPWQAENLAALLDEGNTLPFIARYRKEKHGSLDDQLLRKMAERLSALRALDKRREEILGSMESLGQLTDELAQSVRGAATLSELEDIYRPFRPRRRTRASAAKEKGLEPLAVLLLAQDRGAPAPQELAAPFVDAEKGVMDGEEALAGARDIIAERVSDDADLRRQLRTLLQFRGRLVSRATTEDDSVYRLYYDFDQPLARMASHRVLAINRGEAEGFLKVKVACPEAEAVAICERAYVRAGRPTSEQVREAVRDGYDRLLFPSLERGARADLTQKASDSAIQVFGENLRHLLMQPPARGHTVLAIDPGIRTGCKAAVVDPASRVLDTGVLYPLPQHGRVEDSRRRMLGWIGKYHVTAVAIGNGTASRETERFVAGAIADLPRKPGYTVVNEAGASVYSASQLAAEEMPELDVTLRGAVSLARRLQDPLAELVKIDPKAIGVGQYQHDMEPRALDARLDSVVEDCVNAVGVDVNTASPALLSRVAGIGPALARNIVAFRQDNGPFPDRARLKKVSKLGPKAFVQCAGFLRVPGGANPLDASAVHPESYPAAKKLLGLLGYKNPAPAGLSDLRDRAEAYPFDTLCAALAVGAPTLRDIIAELLKPGRDPREDLPPVTLRTDVLDIGDLAPGMELAGTVRNVVDFGAFVDIGVHRDGLVHISRMATRRIEHPSQVVKVGDVVTVWVASVDKAKNQIALSLIKPCLVKP